MNLNSESLPGPFAVCSPCPCPLNSDKVSGGQSKEIPQCQAPACDEKHSGKARVVWRSILPASWALAVSHFTFTLKRGRSCESQNVRDWKQARERQCGRERGTWGSWCVEAEPDGRKITSGLDWLFKRGHKTALENCKGTERAQLCTCSCYWSTRL